MASEIENKKKSRRVLRGSFTRVANDLEELLRAQEPDSDSINVSWELLQTKYNELEALDNMVYELMVENAAETELEVEVDTRDVYLKRFATLRIKYNKLVDSPTTVHTGTLNSCNDDGKGKRKFKLPSLEFKHYDGSIQGWLGFWAQFKKIHDDESIDNSDKIEYLIQATVSGSRARRLVESYPAMGENYPKIITSMQSRFGREDLQIEVYVRELLKLILTNATAGKNVDIAILYDQIETQVRALETLGITSDKFSAMLYPLIESCLPQDLLRVWQRSASFDSTDETPACPVEDRLKKLMIFLQHEVENEQRIALAAEGFGLTERKVAAKTGVKRSDIPTATGLLNQEVANCTLCSGPHDSETCFKATKMTLEQKRVALSKRRGCFRCLKAGHQTKKCRARLRCIVCSRSHVTLMCPELPINRSLSEVKNEGSECQEDKEASKDSALANNTNTHVFLQSLCVMLNGERGSKQVRALIDTGSQRSYILKETAAQLGYQPKRHEKLIHCFVSKRFKHLKRFNVL